MSTTIDEKFDEAIGNVSKVYEAGQENASSETDVSIADLTVIYPKGGEASINGNEITISEASEEYPLEIKYAGYVDIELQITDCGMTTKELLIRVDDEEIYRKYPEAGDICTYTGQINESIKFSGNFTILQFNKFKTDAFSQGKQAAKSEFWDIYQNNGNRKNYDVAFGGYGWNADLFSPKYDINPSSCYMMFRSTGISGDLDELFAKLRVTFDTSQSTNFGYMFQQANQITRIGTLDLTSLKGAQSTDALFNNCNSLKTIDLIRTDNEEFFKFGGTAFNYCDLLSRIRFEGKIVEGIRFSYCPLDLESAINVITHLKNYSGTDEANSYTVYFSNSTLNLLDADGATASPNGNSWRDYISDLGWNV